MSESLSPYRTEKDEIPKPIDRLFLKMATAYGKHWFDMWAGIPPELVKEDWQASIAKNKFTLSAVLKAVDVCREKQKFPPTLPEFIQICKSQQTKPFMQAIGRKFTAEERAENIERLRQATKSLTVKPKLLNTGENE